MSVYRDTDALWAAGLPVVGIPGSGFSFEEDEVVAEDSMDRLEVEAAVEALTAYAQPWEREGMVGRGRPVGNAVVIGAGVAGASAARERLML